MRALTFVKGTGNLLPEQIFGNNIATTFGRTQLLTLQYTKLLNYHGDDLVPEWGGDFYRPLDAPAPREGLARFLEDMGAYDDDGRKWIAKRFTTQPWGPNNTRLRDEPERSLGAPYEAYLALNGNLLVVNQAARLLCVDPGLLIQLKLQLLYDEVVVLECIKRMLRPRSMWPKIRAVKGGAARTPRIKS